MENTATPPPSTGKVEFESAFNLFKPSMHATRLNLKTFIGTILVPFVPVVILIALTAILAATSHSSNSPGTVILLILTIVATIFMVIACLLASPALTYITLKGAQGQRVGVKEAYTAGRHFFWRYLGLSILLVLIYGVSLLLFIVPFFFVLPRYYLAPNYLIDRDLDIIESLKRCAAEYKLYHGVWGLIGVLALIEIPGFIHYVTPDSVAFLGTFITFVLAILYLSAPAIRYFQIKNKSGSSDTPQATTTPVAPAPPITSPEPPEVPTPPVAPQPPIAPPRPLVQ
jgi:hypothetical protein